MYVRVYVFSCAYQCVRVRVRVRVRVSGCASRQCVRACKCTRLRACVFVFVLTRACAIGVRKYTDVNIVRT